MTFDKRHSNITKGVAVLLLLFHHLFCYEQVPTSTFFLLSSGIVHYAQIMSKVCVAIFIFVTAYGITQSTKEIRAIPDKALRNDAMIRSTARRYFSLMMSFAFVFVLVLILDLCFFQGIRFSAYGSGYNRFVYLLVDFLGLSVAFITPTLNMTWWYMSLAQLIIFAMPLLIAWFDKMRYGALAIAIICYIPFVRFFYFEFYYIIPALWGIAAAQQNLFERFHALQFIKNERFKGLNAFIRILMSLLWVLFSLSTYFSLSNMPLIGYMMAAPGIAVFCFEFVSIVPVLNRIIEFIGKNSLNIFLTHTFIYYYYFQNWVFSFNYAITVYLIVLALSLAVSVIIELLKKLTQYNRLTSYVLKRFEPVSSTEPR